MHGVAVTCDWVIATGEERLGDMVFDSAQERVALLDMARCWMLEVII